MQRPCALSEFDSDDRVAPPAACAQQSDGTGTAVAVCRAAPPANSKVAIESTVDRSWNAVIHVSFPLLGEYQRALGQYGSFRIWRRFCARDLTIQPFRFHRI